MATQKSTPKAAATTKPAEAKAAPAKLNARAHLRALFAKVGDVKTQAEVFADYHAVTIRTHLTDLKNVNYAGKAGVISIVKMADGTYKRVA